ncbi:MAG: hypothetical protein A2075_17070 [Geobacteraceae bacterium GWC2_58_44]|nr:MAG: hypothetical protein A2075_17070 [Geobacteraceae bacterium GWC2_58_44]HBG07004.1 hypothetical protein [Geobacter sp.]
MSKLMILWLAFTVMSPSFIYAASGSFSVSKDTFYFPDGTSAKTAPKDGKSVLNGIGAPSLIGNVGDFYIDTQNNRLYGPYNGSWGTGVSLVGPQGSKGDPGAAGKVTLAMVCDAIAFEGAQLPSFCPGYKPTYSKADLKGTWKVHSYQSINDDNGNFHDMFWSRQTVTIDLNGVATMTDSVNSGNEPGSTQTISFNITADGLVVAPANPGNQFAGNMSMDKNLIVYTLSPGSTGNMKGIGMFVKVAP